MSSLQGDIEAHKNDISRLQNEVKKRDSIISSLKNDIDGLKKEIQERDDTIQDKVVIVQSCSDYTLLYCVRKNVFMI